MKKRNIEKTIESKIDSWLKTIEDLDVRRLASRNTIVTGGCITSMLLNDRVNDFDIYFRNIETVEAVTNYYVERFKKTAKVKGLVGSTDISVKVTPDRVKIIAKSVGVVSEESENYEYEYFENSNDGAATRYVEGITSTQEEAIEKHIDMTENLNEENDGNYRPIFISSNAITLSDKVQIVVRFFGDPATIHENYDFVHCTNYWNSWDRKLVLNEKALESILTKELRYVGSKYPICSLLRLRKFISRGWSVHAGQVLKIVFQIQDLDLKDPVVLEDQLTGVDQAYFLELIQKVKGQDQKIDSAYLVELVDKMMG